MTKISQAAKSYTTPLSHILADVPIWVQTTGYVVPFRVIEKSGIAYLGLIVKQTVDQVSRGLVIFLLMQIEGFWKNHIKLMPASRVVLFIIQYQK